MRDRSSRPYSCPGMTPSRTQRRIIKVRVVKRWGPAVHRVLVRFKLARLSHLDRTTGAAVRRHEHPHPVDMVHVDIKKLGNVPPGGGKKALGRQAGRKNVAQAGYSYIHTAVDDHSRLAYSEILADEKKTPPACFGDAPKPSSPTAESPCHAC